jgi:predicted O-methyltransferase YrrM
MHKLSIDNFRSLDERDIVDNPYVSRDEYRVLFDIIESNDIKNILEIGVSYGRTSRNILKNFSKIERYIGVDVDEFHSFEKIPSQVTERPSCPGEFALSLNDSRFEIFLFPNGIEDLKGFDGFFDLVIIDGDHSYSGVKKDTSFAKKLIRKNGFIFWHDYDNLAGVNKFIDEYNSSDSVVFVRGCRCCYDQIFGTVIRQSKKR